MQEQQQAFLRQQEALQRAQRAEEERARSDAALHALQQHNLQLQQQQEAQRLAGLERDRQQRLREEQEQRDRHVDASCLCSVLMCIAYVCLVLRIWLGRSNTFLITRQMRCSNTNAS